MDDGETLPPLAPTTELRNPRTTEIDQLPTLGVLQLLNAEDALVVGAVARGLPALASLVDVAADRFQAGGNIHYFGAGTSGRIGALDAAELPPTFSTTPERVVSHLSTDGFEGTAGESAEDDRAHGRRHAVGLRRQDMAIGLAASGRTAYVHGVLEVAHDIGAHTALVTSSPQSPIAAVADTVIVVETGPEAIAGSTRLKAGTAQKLILNSFSTALMIRLGRTYSNLMVDVTPTNAKLQGRVLSILTEASGRSRGECKTALEAAGGRTKVALVSLVTGADAETAAASLGRSGGNARRAMADLRAGSGRAIG